MYFNFKEYLYVKILAVDVINLTLTY